METVNIKAIQLDLKNPKLTTIGDFIQNDTNIIEFTLVENGNVINLNNLDQILINYQKPNKEIITRVATAENNVITYQLGFSEMNEPGLGKLVLQLFKSDNRISTFIVNVNVKKSIEANFSFEEVNNGLVNQVIQEINSVKNRLDDLAFEGVDTSKIATKEDIQNLATKTELSERVKTINGLSPDSTGNINIAAGSAPGNVLLFEDWTPGESVIIGDGGTPTPPINTAPNITSSFNTTTALTTTNISIPYSVTDAQGGNLTATYTKNGSITTATVQTGSNTWNVGTLTAGSNTLKIKVTDSGGLVSNELTFAITATQPTEADTTPPNNVTNLVVSNNTTGTSLTLTWIASTSNDVSGYEIYRGTTLLTTITGTNYNVTGLTVNTLYTFTVKVKDTSNNVSSGTSVTVTTVYVDNIAPILTITPSATFTDTKIVTMTANEAVTIYYTLDGTTPTQTSPVYSTPLTLSATTTVKAFAKDTAGNVSSVQTVVYAKEVIDNSLKSLRVSATDYIKAPILTFDELIMDITPEFEARNQCLFDARDTSTAFLINQANKTEIWQDIIPSTDASRKFNQNVSHFTSGKRQIIQAIFITNNTPTPITSALTLLSNNTFIDGMSGKIHNIKILLSGVIVAEYDFEQEFSSTSVIDKSGNGNHATLKGGTWVSETPSDFSTDTSYRVSLNGTSSRINVPIPTNTKKIEFKVSREGNDTTGYLFDARTLNNAFSSNSANSGYNGFSVDGVTKTVSNANATTDIPNGVTSTVVYTLTNPARSGLLTIGSHNGGTPAAADIMTINVSGIKFYNESDVILNEFNFTTGQGTTLYGMNGTRGTIEGGTWLQI